MNEDQEPVDNCTITEAWSTESLTASLAELGPTNIVVSDADIIHLFPGLVRRFLPVTATLVDAPKNAPYKSYHVPGGASALRSVA